MVQATTVYCRVSSHSPDINLEPPNFALQSSLLRNEDMSCKESKGKVTAIWAAAATAAYGHSCMREEGTLLLPAEPLFRLVILRGDTLIFLRGFVNCIL